MIAETQSVGKRSAFTGLSLNDFSTEPKGRLQSKPFPGFNHSEDRSALENRSELLNI
jgi:hypothetical protein